jgi:hypothetical protein
MAVIHCPSCGKPNPDFLEVCQYCDEPLHGPGTLAGATSAAGAAAPGQPSAEGEAVATPSSELPDWLSRLGAPPEVSAEEEAEPLPLPKGKVTTWLDALRAQDKPEEAESRDWVWTGTLGGSGPDKSSVATSEELPDWLKAVGEPAAPASPTTPAAEAQPDWLRDVGATAAPAPQPALPQAAPAFAAPAEEVPDWLRAASEAPAAGAPSQPQPQPSQAAPAFAAPAEELPDWLRGVVGQPAAQPTEQPTVKAAAPAKATPPQATPSPAAPPQATPAFAASDEELPDWLRAAGGAVAAPGAAPAAAGELPDWLHGLAATAPAAAAPTPSAPAFAAGDEEVPEWLRSAGTTQPQQPEPSAETIIPTAPPPAGLKPAWLQDVRATPPAQPAPEAEVPTLVVPAEEQPEWLRSLGVSPSAAETIPAVTAAAGEEQPEWLRALGIPAAAMPRASGPSGTAPFIGATTALPFEGPVEAIAAETIPIPIPASLPAVPAAAPAAAVTLPVGAGLSKVALPSWLEAMRPVEIQRPTIAPEVDEYEETVGVLAGLRGVLRAEPAAAQSGAAATRVHKLEVSDAQAKQAEGLSRLLAKATEARQAARKRFAVPVARLAVFTVLFVALVLPAVVPAARGLFAPASSWPASAQATFTLLDSLTPARPALVVFDYDPAQSGELDPMAQALVSHLMRRGVPLVGVSTSPAGAALGETLLDGNFPTATYDSGYLNLGYLPGGPLGTAQVSNGLRSSFTTDFRNTYPSAQYASVWDTPILKPVQQLSDFAVIVLVAASPESVRGWLEQVRAVNPPPAVVAAVSAGADPLVRPYYESGQLQGMVTGILGAAQYESQAGVAGAASGIFWDTLGFGLLAVILLLIGGNVYYGAVAYLRRQKRKP